MQAACWQEAFEVYIESWLSRVGHSPCVLMPDMPAYPRALLAESIAYVLPIKGPAKYENPLPLLALQTLQNISESNCSSNLVL